MKHFLLLLLSAFTLLSCSNDESSSTTFLQKATFYRNSPNERQWNFNTQGQLVNITLSDGTVVEEFTYNAQKNLILDVKYTNGVVTESYAVTYNANDIITSINNINCYYNSVSKTYSYNNGTTTINCSVTNDGLVAGYYKVSNTTAIAESSYQIIYNTDGNMTSFEKALSGVTTVAKNFYFGNETNDNPIDEAILAVSRVKSIIDPDFFIDSLSSKSIATGFDYGVSNPYHYNYGFTDSENYHQIGVEVLNNQDLVEFFLFAEYYYKVL
jgi:predicted RND superfamily exporter protein